MIEMHKRESGSEFWLTSFYLLSPSDDFGIALEF